MLFWAPAATRLVTGTALLCILIGSLATAQGSDDVLEGRMAVEVPVGFADGVVMRPQALSAVDDQGSSQGPPRNRADPCSAEAGQGRDAKEFITVDPAEIRFSENAVEWGCAEIRIPVTVPVGADAVELRFVFSRDVSSGFGLPAAVEARQWVTLYEPGASRYDADAWPARCLGDVAYADPSAGSLPQRPWSTTLRLQDCGFRDDTTEILLSFGFAQGAEGGGPSSTVDHAFSATVSDVVLQFHDVPIAGGVRHDDGLDPTKQVLGFTLVGFEVPRGPPWSTDVVFDVQGLGDVIGLYQGTLQQPGKNNATLARMIDVVEHEDGSATITMPAEMWQHGRYQIAAFRAPDSSDVSLRRLPIAAFALLAPLAAGVLAQRNLNHLHRSARGRAPALRRRVQSALVIAWVLYILVAFLLLIGDAGVGLVAASPRLGIWLAYVALAASTVIMIVAGIVARRRELAIVLSDLSELERIQAELERSNRELEQFAYVASHDLKEPLRMVAGYTQLLEMRYGDRLDGQGKEFLDFAADGAQRLQRMVDDLLAYSRVRTDRATFRPVRLDDVVAIVRGHLRQLIQERNVTLIADDLPVIRGDQGQLVQLLLNLVQNAIKFSPQDAPVVEITATPKEDGIVLSVRDEGIGIDPKQQDRIFDIFQRLHLREEYEGNGIGLAMCKKIAEQLGGSIRVESVPGEGATFHVYLPALGEGGVVRRHPRASDSVA